MARVALRSPFGANDETLAQFGDEPGMTNIDQFESLFKSASKEVFHFEPVAFAQVLVITDLATAEAEPLAEDVQRMFAGTEAFRQSQFRVMASETHRDIGDLLQLVSEVQPDLIVSYRCLHSSAWRWPHSLGEHLDVLTQATEVPVLVLPHPEANRRAPWVEDGASCVMAIANHLSGEARLVDVAASLTAADGTLWLTHVEDRLTFERYMDAIEKLPSIDSEPAREALREQLLKEPQDYVQSCRVALAEHKPGLRVEADVTMGHHINDYRQLVEKHSVTLLVFNTKEDGQLAMHGAAYGLAVEMRHIPLLML